MTTHMPNRLAQGGIINRSKSIEFSFNGKKLSGYQGDTLASALIANGVSMVARSFKYHRPRGIFSAGPEEPNALLTLGSGSNQQPNSRATITELYDRLSAQSQNHIGPLEFDLMAINDWFAPFLTAGFYYKTFMWPKVFWENLYEPMIRKAAGLGSLSGIEDDAVYNKGFKHCDLLVIGSGPSGLLAAQTAARAGARVLLAEQDFELAASFIACPSKINDQPAYDWCQNVLAELQSCDNVDILPRTCVFGTYDHGIYGAIEQTTVGPTSKGPIPYQTLWRIYSKQCIVATGATERPIAFGHNDLPGVMLAGAVCTYIHRFGVTPGQKIVGFGTDRAQLAKLDEAAKSAGIDCIILGGDEHVAEAQGRKKVLGAITTSGRKIDCDVIAVAGGWNPNVHLTSHHRCRPVWEDTIHAFVPGPDLPAGQHPVGAAAGDQNLHAALTSAFESTLKALDTLGMSSTTSTKNKKPSIKEPEYPVVSKPLWVIKGSAKRAWVDFQNDVTTKDIKLAQQEGFQSVEHLKRYTTLGMATDQGKVSNVVGLAIMAELSGQSMQQTGTTMFRPPYQPVAMGAFGGRSRGKEFKPTRHTPTHKWATENGAVFVETGNWLRAQWFVQPGEKHWRESVDREVRATREHVGICDVSTLGKIDIQGVDAATFLNKVYANAFAKLQVGKVRYGLMLREDGIVMDDGTTARMSENHFIMTTTTANAVSVFKHLEYCRQCLMPDLDVHLISTTDAWAQIAVAGPKSRTLLQRIIKNPDAISNDVFPFMACGSLELRAGTTARLFRISFSGELAYELAVPTRYGDALVRELMLQGEDLNITAYGTEALGVMRIEKGHPAGNELNGQTTALNLNLDGLVSKKKDSFGRIMSMREGLSDSKGLRLVGLTPLDSTQHLTAGSHITNAGDTATADNDLGYVTSVAYSPTLGHSIGLSLIKRGHERMGDVVQAIDLLNNKNIPVRIVSPHFVDPSGERQRA